MAVYLIHFKNKLGRCQHYIGYAKDVDARIAAHRATTWTPPTVEGEGGTLTGKGATILGVLNHYGIGWDVVQVWPNGDRQLERHLKNQKNARRYCPVCNGKAE
jgi:hypothetical protein